MNGFEKMVQTCKNYQLGKFGIEEFQQRLETILLPEDCKNTLEVNQHNTSNLLEKIQYSYPIEEQKRHADKVAEDLIQATMKEQERLKNYRPY